MKLSPSARTTSTACKPTATIKTSTVGNYLTQPTINIIGEVQNSVGIGSIIINKGSSDNGTANNYAERFSSNLAFGTNEGVIWVDIGQAPLVLSGQITGSGGITISEPYNAGVLQQYLDGMVVLANSANTFTGPFSANGVALEVVALDTGTGNAGHGALGRSTDLYFDGTMLYVNAGSSYGTGATAIPFSGNQIASDRTIHIGPNGLEVELGPAYTNTSITIASVITGSGGLTLAEGINGTSNQLTTSAMRANNYTGGTQIESTGGIQARTILVATLHRHSSAPGR